MTSSTSFNPIAAEEVTEAAAYYGLESNALRSRFLAAVEAAVEEIEQFPSLGRAVRGELRRHLVRGFPYALIYTARGSELRVLAVMHLARRPFYWSRRR